jgi:predicted metal-dependent hydrolase
VHASVTDSEAAFRRGITQFNAGEFWEAHESWEVVWLPAEEPDKIFLQGIIQVSAAFHHYRRSNITGARSLLRRGLTKLELFPGVYRGILLEDLRQAARKWLNALETEGTAVPAKFPEIHEDPQAQELS